MAKVNGLSKESIEKRKTQRQNLQSIGYHEYAYKFRIYVDKTQREFLNKSIGCVRFIYNKMLYLSEENYKNYEFTWNIYDYKKLIPEFKKIYPFLKECPSQALQETVWALDNAYKKYLKGESNKPVFKKKKNGGSIHIPQGWRLEYIGNKFGKLYIPKLKTPLRVRMHININETPKSITIVKEPSGEFYAVFSCIRKIEKLPNTNKAIGIDLGITNYITTSQMDLLEKNIKHNKIANPKHLKKSIKKLKRLYRQLSRKQHPRAKDDKTLKSNNFIKHAKKVAKLHKKVKNQRLDFLHKLSKAIIDENQVIVAEDLNIKGMIKNKYLAQSISDVSWGKFLRMLEYKAKWYGRKFVKINRAYPSSKLCFCGYKNNALKLSDRVWICPKCGRFYDRDEHAADMVLLEGITQVGLERPELTPVERALVDDRIQQWIPKKPSFVEAGILSLQ